MTPRPVSILPTATLDQAAEIMTGNHIHHLPVVRDDETRVGVVTADELNVASVHFRTPLMQINCRE